MNTAPQLRRARCCDVTGGSEAAGAGTHTYQAFAPLNPLHLLQAGSNNAARTTLAHGITHLIRGKNTSGGIRTHQTFIQRCCAAVSVTSTGWSHRQDSNLLPPLYESGARPVMLRWLVAPMGVEPTLTRF